MGWSGNCLRNHPRLEYRGRSGRLAPKVPARAHQNANSLRSGARHLAETFHLTSLHRPAGRCRDVYFRHFQAELPRTGHHFRVHKEPARLRQQSREYFPPEHLQRTVYVAYPRVASSAPRQARCTPTTRNRRRHGSSRGRHDSRPRPRNPSATQNMRRARSVRSN